MKVKYDTEQLKKIANYINSARPLIEKTAAMDAVIAARVPSIVDTLVSQGLVSPHLKEAKIKALQGDMSAVLDTLEKTAALVPAPSLGTGAPTVKEDRNANTVFEDRLFGGK